LANGVKLDVQSSDPAQPAKVVNFTEPDGFDDTVLNAWSTTMPATIIVRSLHPPGYIPTACCHQVV
jgi:hypothetical protein